MRGGEGKTDCDKDNQSTARRLRFSLLDIVLQPLCGHVAVPPRGQREQTCLQLWHGPCAGAVSEQKKDWDESGVSIFARRKGLSSHFFAALLLLLLCCRSCRWSVHLCAEC